MHNQRNNNNDHSSNFQIARYAIVRYENNNDITTTAVTYEHTVSICQQPQLLTAPLHPV